MKKIEVKAGHTYEVKVSGKLTTVRVTGGNPHGGWDGVNLATGKPVRLKSGARLRKPAAQEPPVDAQAKKPARHAPPAASDQAPTDKSVRPIKSMSGLDAAAAILKTAPHVAMTVGQIVTEAKDQRLWESSAKTPVATISSAIIREIATKGDASRFRRVGRGKFEYSSSTIIPE